jgi:hypothetical protein
VRLPEVVVQGRSDSLVGIAESASQGTVGATQLDERPILRPGEVLEAIPGMIVTQHSGDGKANQYFLRGFNLDHGADFAGSIDGVPLNLRAHPHMNGYLDINFMIPEVIEKVQFCKGTGNTHNGDVSAAGSADFSTCSKTPENYVEADLSDDSDYRALVVGSTDIGEDWALLYACEYEWGDGPFDRPGELKKWSGIVKYSQPLQVWGGNANFHAELIAYDNDWHATDQMPQRAVDSGLISRFGTLDEDLGGKSSRYIASAGLDWENASLMAYGEKYELSLYNNPTFYLDQVNGDEFGEVADRSAFGARGQIRNEFTLAGLRTDTRLGADIRTDFIDRSALQRTIDRVPFDTIGDDSGMLTLADIRGDATVHWTPQFRTTFGARVDHMIFDFDAIQAANSGDGSDRQWSPKLSAAYTITGDPVMPSPVFVQSKGGEIGFRWEPVSSFNICVSVFDLQLDSELIFVGDAGTSEPSDPTKRSGIEVSGFWQPMDGIAIDFSGAWSHSRFRDAPANADRIPNAVEFVGAAGVTWTTDDRWEASLRARYIGEALLIEDNSVRGPATFSVNAGLSKDFGPYYVGLDVLNLTDSDDNEIQDFYESPLLREPAPAEDLMIHPLHPRSCRLVLKAKY